MTGVAAEQELYRACRIIFGPHLVVSREFLEYIQLSGVKSAFRKRAMETHPDRLTGLDELTRQRQARMFLAVRSAYEQLSRYVDAREKGFRFQGLRPADPGAGGNGGRPQPPVWRRPTTTAARPAATGSSAWSGHRHQGRIPDRRLLFGQFLYYAGQVSWQDLSRALMWQRAQCPRLGEIACERGWLQRDQILSLLRTAAFSSLPFGERALQHGLLTRAQLQLLLFEQKRRHRRVGEFFVIQQILTRPQLQLLLSRFYRHNARHAPLRPFAPRS